MKQSSLENIFLCCHNILGKRWDKLVKGLDSQNPDLFINLLSQQSTNDIPSFIGDLARLERAVYDAQKGQIKEVTSGTYEVNPTLSLVEIEWDVLPILQEGFINGENVRSLPRKELVMVFKGPVTKKIKTETSNDIDLLVLKIVVENLELSTVVEQGDITVSALNEALEHAYRRGILLKPASLLRRKGEQFDRGPGFEEFEETDIFTIQWHITQACDLRCKHCYDRSSRQSVSIEQGRKVLDNFQEFCHQNHVRGQVSFSGGNPFLHQDLIKLYQEAADRGMITAILGNPVSPGEIDEIAAIQKPVFFQVSLEGLEKQTDYIRGKDHFKRTFSFLDLLKERKIFSMVMLTLTKDNMNDVLPLAAKLNGRTDLFTFNRLAMVGEGANLEPVDPQDYKAFLQEYLNEAKKNPVLRLKDNLFNIFLDQQGDNLSGGCAGYGCGAAFNFLAILSDGEVHACRKFPSPIGNIYENALNEIYYSQQAKQYRSGSKACRSCTIRPVCGGCLAVVHGQGLDVFEDKDPYCFMSAG